jgi:hypothetical protein
MSTLNSLKLVSFQAPAAVDPKAQRRNKLVDRISRQIAAATAAANGTVYTEGEKQRRIKQWFHAVDDKRWAVMLMYGSKTLELAKGKNAVECAGLAGVVTSLEAMKSAVLAGELDAQIAAAADALKRGFKKK